MSSSSDEEEAKLQEGWSLDFDAKFMLVGLFGRLGAGKSNLLAQILKQGCRKRWKWVVVFTPTPEGFEYLPEEAVYCKEDWPDKFLGITKQIDKYKAKMRASNKPVALSKGVICLDDTVGSNQKLMFRPDFINALTRARHQGWDCIFTSQLPLGVPPAVRALCSTIAAFRMQGHNQTKKLFKFMSGGMEDGGHREFTKLLNAATVEPFSCLIYTANAPKGEAYLSFTPAPPSEKKWLLKYKLPFRL